MSRYEFQPYEDIIGLASFELLKGIKLKVLLEIQMGSRIKSIFDEAKNSAWWVNSLLHFRFGTTLSTFGTDRRPSLCTAIFPFADGRHDDPGTGNGNNLHLDEQALELTSQNFILSLMVFLPSLFLSRGKLATRRRSQSRNAIYTNVGVAADDNDDDDERISSSHGGRRRRRARSECSAG